MKHFLFFLLLFILFFCPAQPIFSQLKPGGTLEAGYEDRIIRINDNYGNDYASSWLRNKGFADIHLNLNYKCVSVYTDVKSLFDSETLYRYNPVQVEYKLGINYRIKRFSFNWEHLCSHSIDSNYLYDAYDRISIKVKLF